MTGGFHLLIKIFLRLGADGLYFATKGIPLRGLCLPDSLDSLRHGKRDLKLQIFSSNFVSEELVLRSLSASPFINPFFTPGA